VLTAASLRKMTTPFRENYALGLLSRKTSNGDRIFSHDGGIEGFNTWVGYIPAQNVEVIVLANLNGVAPDDIAKDLIELVDGDKVTLTSDGVHDYSVVTYRKGHRRSLSPVALVL
jgi:Beta-lactamase